MLRELRVSELRNRAVLELLDGATVTSVSSRFGVSSGTVHVRCRLRVDPARWRDDGGWVHRFRPTRGRPGGTASCLLASAPRRKVSPPSGS